MGGGQPGRARAWITPLRNAPLAFGEAALEGGARAPLGIGYSITSFGAGEQRLRHGEAERLAGFQIDDQFELSWPLNLAYRAA